MLQPQRDEEFRVEILLLRWLHWIKIFCGKIVIILGNIFLYFPNLLNSIFGQKLEYCNLYLLKWFYGVCPWFFPLLKDFHVNLVFLCGCFVLRCLRGFVYFLSCLGLFKFNSHKDSSKSQQTMPSLVSTWHPIEKKFKMLIIPKENATASKPSNSNFEPNPKVTTDPNKVMIKTVSNMNFLNVQVYTQPNASPSKSGHPKPSLLITNP